MLFLANMLYYKLVCYYAVSYVYAQIVKAQIVFWTAGFVLLTLLLNAPMLPWVLNATRLNTIPAKKLERRRRAVAALKGHTLEVIQRLRDDEDELLAGGCLPLSLMNMWDGRVGKGKGRGKGSVCILDGRCCFS
jgi:NhaP-type Na+/H+ or K+/H+ antiporter